TSLIGLEVGFIPWSVAHQGWIKNTGSAGGVAMAITDSGGAVMNTGDVLAPDNSLRRTELSRLRALSMFTVW
ncbi:hypothetical protein, partial [Salmonella enterica]|uniref:hypothetical protein n=1 Tax=Salmonella enterica TaxID=28901 RepID=UPI0021B4C307